MSCAVPEKKRPTSLLNDPDHWRKSAADMRDLAQTSTGPARESFIKIAAEYDKLAERAKARLRKAKAAD
jgi:hypothetical protein